MHDMQAHPVIKGIVKQLDTLTPKGKILGSYIIQNPRKAVFMTTKELSEACGVSEATVVRFVGQLGYSGYGDFLQALRDFVDSGLTLPDRVDLPGMKGPGTDLLHRVVFEEMNNLRQFYEVNTAVIPATRGDENRWRDRDAEMTKKASMGDIDLAFIGDSITQGWGQGLEAALSLG